MSDISISFVIPHKGREEFLARTIQSIDGQQTNITHRIIVVTQNPQLSEQTLSTQNTPIEVIYVDERLTISALRNEGAKATDSSHLAFLDADIHLSANWIDAMLNELIRPDVKIASAVQIAGEEPTPLEQIRTALSNAMVDCAVGFLPGRNLLMLRSTFDAVGGFPEHLTTCEDYWFTDHVAKLGLLWYSRKATYIHLGEDKKLPEMFKKEIWRGQSNLQSLQGRSVPLSEWPSFVIPPWIAVLALLSIVLCLAGLTILGATALVLALLPFVAYVIRLYFLANATIPIRHIVGFYGYYFPARAWGSLVGAFTTLGHRLHDR